jgi:hypothetical protein
MTMQELGATIGTWLGVIVALLTLRPVIGKQLDEYRHRHRARLRTEAEFAIKLAQVTGNAEHAKLAEQLGLSALLGDADLAASQRQRLLALEDPVFWANQFDRCKDLVFIDPEGRVPFAWLKESHQEVRGRNRFKVLAFAGFVTFILLGFLPGYLVPYLNQQQTTESTQLLTPVSTQPAKQESAKAPVPLSVAISLMVWLVLMLSAAVYCLTQTMKLNDAERLIGLAEAEAIDVGAGRC